jgi:uncharacterized protein
MSTRALIDEFLSHHDLALMRTSPDTPVRGARIDQELAAKGYKVTVVYVDESVAGPRLSALEDPVQGVIIAVRSDYCERAVREAIEAGIPRVWIQRGCESRSAIELCERNAVPVVYGECVLMYAEPVRSVHAFHRWLWKKLGRFAQ